MGSQAQKIVATEGKKNVGALTSGKKRKTVTVVCCISATGTYVPPTFVFPRVKMKQSLMDHSPAGAVGTSTKSGWINKESFDFWFDHFLKFVRPKDSPQPVLLVFDGHSSHTQNLNVVLKARENNVSLICLLSHCSHRLQPLDVVFFKSLNAHYDDECRKWLREHPGQKIMEERIPGIFCYGKSATVATAVNGFKKTGIAPLDRGVFTDSDFLAADMTDQPLEESEPCTSQHQQVVDDNAGGPAVTLPLVEPEETSTACTRNDVTVENPCASTQGDPTYSNNISQSAQVICYV